MIFQLTFNSKDNYDPKPPMPPYFTNVSANSSVELKLEIAKARPSTEYTVVVVKLEQSIELGD